MSAASDKSDIIMLFCPCFLPPHLLLLLVKIEVCDKLLTSDPKDAVDLRIEYKIVVLLDFSMFC